MTGGHSPFQNECRLLVPSLDGSGAGCTGPLCSPAPVGWGVSPGAHPEGWRPPTWQLRKTPRRRWGRGLSPRGQVPRDPRPRSLRAQPCLPACLVRAQPCQAGRGPAAAWGRRGAISLPCWEPGDSSGSRRCFSFRALPTRSPLAPALRESSAGSVPLPVSGT